MEVLDINTFLSYKFNENVQELDNKTLELLNELFGQDKNKKNKKTKKPNINLLKNQKIQNKKDNIINKVNLILNKLSESNIHLLVNDFLENINQIDEEQFNEIQKAFYLKIISEINFIKIYLEFFKIIVFIYSKIQSYNIKFFISSIETKFKIDYTDFDLTPENKFEYIKDLNGESKRINNLILIKNLIDYKFLSLNIYNYCDKTIINQNIFLTDIYYWFNMRNKELTVNEKDKIKTYLKDKNIGSRENILLENLLSNQQNNKNEENKINFNTINTDTLKLETENIIDEYLLYKSFEDIKYFINTRCNDAINKNKFSEFLIDKYFLSDKENSTEIIELVKELIKNQILFKSNLSRGLILISNNWNEISIDYEKSDEKMKNLLIILKNLGITKNLESLIKQYNL